MNPEEKAKELYDKMLQWQTDSNIYIQRNITSINAKKSSLIAVEEILDITKRPTYNQDNWNEITGFRYDKFWSEVKHEIEQL